MTSLKKTAFLCLFIISGACGLAYEIAWSRMLVLVFGGTMFAITTVLVCFMGGLAAGSHIGARLSRQTRTPARLYGMLEIGIGLYCLAVPFLLDHGLPLYRAIATAAGGSLFVLTAGRVIVCAFILIIPTCLMGATLPLLVQAFWTSRDQAGRSIGLLYGLNSFGAFAGCTLAGFTLLPMIGLSKTVWLAAALNIIVGITAMFLSRGATHGTASLDPVRPGASSIPAAETGTGILSSSMRRFLLLVACVMGFAGMAYQVVWTRALILAMGSSTYAFSAIVAMFILGISIGSLLVSRFAGRIRSPAAFSGALELVIGLSALLVVPLFGEMPGLVMRLAQSPEASFWHILGSQALCVFGLLVVPTVCMGAAFPLMCVAYHAASGKQHDQQAGHSTGIVYAWNTIGSIIGVCLAGFVLVPWSAMGVQRTIILVSAINGIIGTALLLAFSTRKLQAAISSACFCGAGVIIAMLSAPWSRAVMVSGPYLGRGIDPAESVIFYREGADSTVSVSDLGGRNLVMRINGKPDASSRIEDLCTQILAADIPLLLNPSASRVCVIGLGSGITCGAALDHPIERLDVAEISDAVIEAAKLFARDNSNALENPRLALHYEDGRNFLLTRTNKYNVIICEPSNPWISGIANLYTREFFELARNHLDKGGVHCQWIHSYSMRPDDFAGILHTMAGVFQHVQLWSTWSGDYLAIGSDTPLIIDLDAMKTAFERPPVKATLDRILIGSTRQMGNHYVGDERTLAAWYRKAESFRDDLPRLEFSASRHVIRNEGMTIGKTLDEFKSVPVLAGEPDSAPNAEFLNCLAGGRKAREHLRDSVAAAWSNDSRKYLDSLLGAAANAPEDMRVLLVVLGQLESQLISGTEASKAVGLSAYRKAVESAPMIQRLEKILSGKKEAPALR
ncbi:MAG: hypothetical protein C0404_04755 [Verrucomicrobia bacterium]|nr:hypothetical protein [Verrucomicrobiota bacterium]